MTYDETVQIMILLGGYYGAGKVDPKMMAQAWYLVLKDYDYRIAQVAVINFAKHDARDYASFPTVGKIVQAIEAESKARSKPIREIKMAISYGRQYDQLPDDCKRLISKADYDSWLGMDAEEFEKQSGVLVRRLTEGAKVEDHRRLSASA